MDYKEGYVYHISDTYFELAKDEKLMQNKECGNYRPTFFCVRDSSSNLLWMVPMSTRIEKYKVLHDRQVEKYGNCLTIVLGEFDGKQSAFLLQNMFPVIEKYLDHVHTKNGNPVPIKYSVHQEIKSKMKQVFQLLARGKRLVFPDIVRLEALMRTELENEKQRASIKLEMRSASPEQAILPKLSIQSRLEAAKEKSAQLEREREHPDRPDKGQKYPSR